MGDRDPKSKDAETMAVPSAIASDLARASNPPEVLGGRYELLGLIGSGGMGSVYRARDRELDEVVALKMLRKELVDTPGVLARFRQEVKLARRVTHRNVARTFDIGEHGGEKFITMEYIDGESLGDVLARAAEKGERGLPLERVVGLAMVICGGLGAAHAAGVVHRDLKPDNVLLGKDGRVVINDFGIARAAVDAVNAAKTQGMPLGTPAYMAPEQVQGSANIDARADLYALGAMLFELLTGRRAWTGDSVYAVATARLVEPPPDPRAVRPDVPDAAARLVMKCMARAPEDRYASVEDVVHVLAGMTMLAPKEYVPSESVQGASNAPGAVPAPISAANVRVTNPTPASTSGTRPLTREATRSVGGDVRGADGEAKSIAVLPFRNAGAPEDEYLADGLTEDLIDALSMARGLRVRSRGAVMKYKGADADPRTLGRELDVQVTVEGSVRRAGANVRVSVRLVSVEDGFQLWAKRFEGPPSEVLAMGDEAADAIAQALTVKRAAPQRDAPTDPVALDLYMRARHEYHKFWREGVERSIVLFKEALDRAPDDPMIMSGYAMALMRRFSYDEAGDGSGALAEQLANRAMLAAPHLGEPRVAMAALAFNTGENFRGAQRLREAMSIAPDSSDVQHWLGMVLLEIDRAGEGIAHLQRAIALQPQLYPCRWDIARAHALMGDWEKADAYFAEKPTADETKNVYWINRWRVAMWRRDTARAQALLDEVHAEAPFAIRYAAEAVLSMMVTGTLPEMALQEIDARAESGRAKRRRSFFRMMKAELLAYAGKHDGAMEAIAEAEASAFFDIMWIDRCPLLDPMRQAPRFADVRRRVAERAGQIESALGLVGVVAG